MRKIKTLLKNLKKEPSKRRDKPDRKRGSINKQFRDKMKGLMKLNSVQSLTT